MFQASLLYPPFLPIANTCRNLRHVIPLWALGHKGAIVMLCSEIQIYRNMEFSLEADRNLLNGEIDLSSYSHRDSVTYNDLAIVTRGTVACRKKNHLYKGRIRIWPTHALYLSFLQSQRTPLKIWNEEKARALISRETEYDESASDNRIPMEFQ